MEGLVSPLDAAHDAAVQALVNELTEALPLTPAQLPPFPHFSYQIALSYTRDALPAAVEALARAQPPFTVTTTGVALFTNAAPVLYLPIIRTAALSAFHRRMWEALLPLADGLHPYYAPDQWVPHITLAVELDAAGAAEAVRMLAGRVLDWTITIDALCFAVPVDATHVIEHRVPLGGG